MYDYAPGEADWLAYWLPWDGEAVMAGQAMRTVVTTCGPAERVAAVRERLARGTGRIPVLNGQGVVLGMLDGEAAEADAGATVEDVMIVGPSTIRPSEPLEALTGRMADRDVKEIAVTSSDGRLLGILARHDAEAVLAAAGRG